MVLLLLVVLLLLFVIIMMVASRQVHIDIKYLLLSLQYIVATNFSSICFQSFLIFYSKESAVRRLECRVHNRRKEASRGTLEQ